jgi:hypothetical protein
MFASLILAALVLQVPAWGRTEIADAAQPQLFSARDGRIWLAYPTAAKAANARLLRSVKCPNASALSRKPSSLAIRRASPGFDMRCAVDPEQFLVRRAGGPGEGIFGHVPGVGLAAGDHQQRLLISSI